MELLGTMGRVVFSAMFVMSGVNHLTKRHYMTEYASQMGVPAARFVVPASGIMLLAGAVMVTLGIWGDLGALLIAAFLIPTAIYMHAPWKFDGEEAQGQQVHFMKNLTMAGGALVAAAYFLCAEAGWTITGPLFG